MKLLSYYFNSNECNLIISRQAINKLKLRLYLLSIFAFNSLRLFQNQLLTLFIHNFQIKLRKLLFRYNMIDWLIWNKFFLENQSFRIQKDEKLRWSTSARVVVQMFAKDNKEIYSVYFGNHFYAILDPILDRSVWTLFIFELFFKFKIVILEKQKG
jgi:hypothetical protein